MMTILEEEKDILHEKLQIHMGLWALDKKQFEDDHIEAVRSYLVGKESGSAQAYEIAKLNVTLNSEKQRSHSTECKLEDAIAENDELQKKVFLLNNLLKQEKEKVDAAEKRVSSQGVSRELLHAAVTRESEKHEQANQKIHQLQELLESAKVTHREQVDALGADYMEKEAKSDGRMLRLLQEMDVSLKKNESLEEELCKCQSQRKSLAKWLVNESSFLNGQLKTLDTRHAARLQEKDKELNKAREDFEQLQRILEDVQRKRDENGVQVTVLKLEVAELDKEAANVKAIGALMKENPSLERQNVQKDLQQKTLEIERFSALLSAKECALENLSVEKEALYDQLELTKKDFQEEKKAARDFVAAEKEHKKQLKELEKQCTAATKLVERKEDRVQKLEQQLEQLQNKEHTTGSETFSHKNKVEEGNKKQLREIEKKHTEVVTEKEELLKKVMGQLDELRNKNENLKAQLESKEKINKQPEEAHPKQMEELEKLVAVQAENLRKLSQQLGDSEKTCSKVEAYWTHQNSKVEEIHKKDLEDIEKRCTDTTKLVHEKEEALTKVKQQLQDLQKKIKSLETQATTLREQDAAIEVQQAKPRTRNGKTRSAATTETLQDGANVPIEPSSECPEKESGSSRRGVRLNERRKQGGLDIPPLPQATPRARKSSGATAETFQDATCPPREQSAEDLETESGSTKRGVSLNKRRKKVPVDSGSTTASFTRVVEQAMDTASKENDLRSAIEAARDNNGASLPLQRKGSANRGPLKRKAKEGIDPTPSEKKRPPIHPGSSRLSNKSRRSDTGQLLPAELLLGSNSLLPKTNLFSAAFSVPRLKTTSSGGSVG